MLGGELVFHFINVVVLTALAAPIVLWRYRRAVLAGMRATGAAPLPVAAVNTVARDRARAAAAGAAADAALAWERRMRRRIFAAVLAALAPPALLLAGQYFAINRMEATPAHVFIVAAVTCSAAVPIFAVLTATPFWRALALLIATCCALAAAGVVVSMAQRPFYGKLPTLDQTLNFVAFFRLANESLWIPLLLGLAIGARRVRGVAPLAFAGLLVFAIALVLGVRLTQWLAGMRWSAPFVLGGPGLDAGFVVLALPIGLVAWWRLKSLARRYRAKRFSEAQLLAHSWWLALVATAAVQLVSVHPEASALLPIVVVSTMAYLLFPFLLALALRRAWHGVARPPPRTLLVLRVFGDTRRAEGLFDRIASRWRLFGPVTTIAAPDIAARTVDPGDLLSFASGDIADTFVRSAADLQRRMAWLDTAPDPDGRYRIEEFCCRDDTWRATVVELIERADAVLMDLRAFTAERHGCEFELGELAARSDPARVVLLVDASTDLGLLARSVPPGSAPMRQFMIDRSHGGQVDAAFTELLRAAA
ncbi:MAG: hypothetical protein ABI364_05950 [Caldimonas sp.]